ncbi:MAG TPA: anthranilate synthase component I [Ignavibacteriales bacterium]|nr:anthranilate synthase component I [Ignavibacteriales bacterium]
MTFEQFNELAKNHNLIPVYEVITADLLTPVAAYLKIRQSGKASFLLESVEGSLSLARYSFIGVDPEKTLKNKKKKLFISRNHQEIIEEKSIFDQLREEINGIKQAKLPELPSFTGGIVGFLGYENISLIEDILATNQFEELNKFDSMLGIYKTILAFDHYKHQIIIITNVLVNDTNELEKDFEKAKKILNDLKIILLQSSISTNIFKISEWLKNDFDKVSFNSLIINAKDEITKGEIIQIVLSKKFSAKFEGDLFNVYRALRIINPSPYMYFLEFEDNSKIIGTSPEDLLQVKNLNARVLPIAGTRRRGKNEKEDIELEADLLNDPKELAEHTMLVDLGRNDLGRVCKYGSVKVSELMKIQKYSHVMHIVSKVEGEIVDGKDSIDALKSCFPAGTVTGAPKIRAMQLISNFEKEERNVYAGAVGYLDFSGDLDMCIAIRTLFSKENLIYWQSGAGIVADSNPELEAKEIINKSAVMVNALKYAEEL